MITVRVGDLFESKAQTLVNTVNCVGIMGKGIALGFKERFPAMFRDYEERCRIGRVRLGKPYLYKDLVGPWILNFPTKDHWRSVSRLQDIVAGLEYLKTHYREWGVRSLAVPPLGCGHGGLEWRVVGPTLYRHLSELDIPIELYAPHGTPERELTREFLAHASPQDLTGSDSLEGGKVRPEWIALVEILARVLREPYHWPVGRTTFQKMAYFASDAGLPTGLRYERGSFGPYSPTLKKVLTTLVNQGLIREQKFGRMLKVQPGPTFNDARALALGEVERWDEAIDRVSDLFLRMRTDDAEVAATVLHAARSLSSGSVQRPSESDVVGAVMRWKERRRPPLKENDVKAAVRRLNLLGWIDLKPSKELEPADEELALA